MRLVWKIFRTIVSVMLLAAVVLPAAIYVLLSLPAVQRMVRDTAASELSSLLGAEVNIDRVSIHPFNRATVRDISLVVASDTVARIATVSAGFELLPLISQGNIVIDYALVDGVEAHINRATPYSPLNIQPIVDRLKSDNSGEKKKLDLRISSVIIRRAAATYDILSAPAPDSARFDPAHIAVSDLAINAFIPQISDRAKRINIDHLSLRERSGFVLDKLTANCALTDSCISLDNFSIALPNTQFMFEPMSLCGGSPAEAMRSSGTRIVITDGSEIYPPDLQAFVPILSSIDRSFLIDLDAEGSLQAVNLRRLNLSDADGSAIDISLQAQASGLDSIGDMHYRVWQGVIDINGIEMAALASAFLKPELRNTLRRLPDLRFGFNGDGSLKRGTVHLKSTGTAGTIAADVSYFRPGRAAIVDGSIQLADFAAGLLASQPLLGNIDATANFTASFGRSLNSASGEVKISKIEYKGHDYSGISLTADLRTQRSGEVNLTVNDPAAYIKAYALYDFDKDRSLNVIASVSDLDPQALNLTRAHPGCKISGKLLAEISNFDLGDLDGSVNLTDLRWVDGKGAGLRLDAIRLNARPDKNHALLSIESPYIEGSLSGHYDFTTLVPTLADMLYHYMPALDRRSDAQRRSDPGRYNNFNFEFTLRPTRPLAEFFSLPIDNLAPATLSGCVDSRAGYANIDADLPYLYNGKVIENSHIFGRFDISAGDALLYATTKMPTKKGDMTIAATVRGANNKIDTHLDWDIERNIPINGTIDFGAELLAATAPAGSPFPIEATLDMQPGTINFGDDTWHIEASHFHLMPQRLNVDGFALDTGTQRIEIDGNVGTSPADTLSVGLGNVRLLPIFETLEIDKAMIGGRAQGHITATDLLSGAPKMQCPLLHVDSISYNRCAIGNADIVADWDNDRQGVYLDAAITGFEGRHSRIDGYIFPMGEALDFNFDADSVPVAFLRPFMEAFASDITGRASGKCHLFGTFKEIDLEGDIFADNVGLKIDFTNTMYHATDSVHLRPGIIQLNNIVIRDPEGHTALLNGNVGHTFFKAPTFKFNVTQARDFLSYNVTSRQNPDWYGTIYGNGGASITGWPGVVNINVNMTTAPRSTFTFVLSDRLDAEDYSFLTFRDVTPDSLRRGSPQLDDTPVIVKTLKEAMANNSGDEPSQYNMDIVVNITDDAKISLVMDPAGGDEIKAIGAGNMHLAYHSANNDLNIWGNYTVQTGSYRFTLQDIIIKDFTIKDGSEISFDGDPYGVKTKISAYYATNANLSDLDESFLQDKEVARTNVPVHALLKMNGDIRQPSLEFDLEFPTLTSDTYRKVKSIVSTEDMMNRQIIYLLALNRFYTPDYMSSTTKGNELFSVASSTISGQLGNMLGKLSDNWSIAPNLRSDRGDFSDIEVDVALSSRLLNNRLLFNGNFGYRDKTLNTNQFVGDFDIEYLLNKRGTWRLKAYNRYNDRNFYVRSAQTTQGVGIMFRRDFDNLFNFLRPKHHAVPADTTSTGK